MPATATLVTLMPPTATLVTLMPPTATKGASPPVLLPRLTVSRVGSVSPNPQ
jgi:hypothetical protein